MNEALITFPRWSIRLTVPKGVVSLPSKYLSPGFFCLTCYESSEKASQSERVQISSQHERVMTESCGSDAAVKKAPYSSAALETEAPTTWNAIITSATLRDGRWWFTRRCLRQTVSTCCSSLSALKQSEPNA